MNKNVNLPPVSRYSSRKEWEEFCWRRLLKAGNVLKYLTTPCERRRLVRRAAVMTRYASGKSYRQIADELDLSPQTISTIRKSINESCYRSYRERGKTERKKKEFNRYRSPRKERPAGRPVRTKYGTVYLPF